LLIASLLDVVDTEQQWLVSYVIAAAAASAAGNLAANISTATYSVLGYSTSQ
jgi:hypothetical protein